MRAAAIETPTDSAVQAVEKPAVRQRPPAIRYLGFEVTSVGREYSLQISHGIESRTFVVLVGHDVFATGKARFQDAPDLCYQRLGRELLADPDLATGARIRLTTDELLDYRDARERGAPGRKRRGSGG